VFPSVQSIAKNNFNKSPEIIFPINPSDKDFIRGNTKSKKRLYLSYNPSIVNLTQKAAKLHTNTKKKRKKKFKKGK